MFSVNELRTLVTSGSSLKMSFSPTVNVPEVPIKFKLADVVVPEF